MDEGPLTIEVTPLLEDKVIYYKVVVCDATFENGQLRKTVRDIMTFDELPTALHFVAANYGQSAGYSTS